HKRLRVRHHRGDIAPAYIRRDDDAALAVFPADLVRPLRDAKARDLAQGDAAGDLSGGVGWKGNGQILQRVDIAAGRLGEAHYDFEMAIAFVDRAGFAPADGGADDLLHGPEAQAAARDVRLVGGDLQHRQAGDLLDPHIRRAVEPAHNP